MRIAVKVKPKSQKEYVKSLGENQFVVAVTEPPEKGNANEAVIQALAEYFGIAPSLIGIVSGATSRQKIVEIDAPEEVIVRRAQQAPPGELPFRR